MRKKIARVIGRNQVRMCAAIIAAITALFQLCLGYGAPGQDMEADFRKGTDYLQEGKWDLAIGEFKNIISADPRHTGAHFNLGCAYALNGDYDKAIGEFEQALSLETAPFHAFCYFNIAGTYTKEAMIKKDLALFKKAAENYTKTVAMLPNFVLAIDHAGFCQTIASQTVTVDKIIQSIDEIGLPPDSVMFLPEAKIMGAGGKKSLCL